MVSILESMKIKIAIADDHTLFRAGMSGLLTDTHLVEVVLEAANGKELLDALDQMNPEYLPELVLMDLQMPEMDGFEAIKQIADKYTEIKVLALSMHNTDQVIIHVMDCGASGFLPKDADLATVLNAIQQVHKQGIYLCERTTGLLRKRILAKKNRGAYPELFNERELKIIRMICDQKNAREIGEALELSPRTVETHKAIILKKTGAKNTAGIVMYALNNNLITRMF